METGTVTREVARTWLMPGTRNTRWETWFDQAVALAGERRRADTLSMLNVRWITSDATDQPESTGNVGEGP